MSIEEPAASFSGPGRWVQVLSATFLIVLGLYLARVVFEPIVFALFGIALVRPFQTALETRLKKSIALGLTILLVLLVIFVLAAAIVWSIDDIVHWIIANNARFQSLYARCDQWLEGYGIYITEGAKQYDSRTFIGLLRTVAAGANYFAGFCVIVFLLITFGLTELDSFRSRLDALAPKIGFEFSRTATEIAGKIRKYMLIRTVVGVLTGLAVFAFTFSLGLDLAIAWAVISFVLNYIPYLGPLIAVILPVLFSSVQFASWQMIIVIFGGLYAIKLITGNYLEPIIAGNALAISPLVMRFAFFFWIFLWGLPGAFIGIPVTIALLTIFAHSPSLHWLAKLLSAPD